MSRHWLLITFSWLGTVSLQYINTGGPGADTILDPLDSSLQYSLPYANYFNVADTPTDADTSNEGQYVHDGEMQRNRRTVNEKEQVREKRWLPNLADTDKTTYMKNNEEPSPFVIGFSNNLDENDTLVDPGDKKSFSPWGGKRDRPSFEHMWTWKRSSSVREPSMPKRVRFSPWGGKRSTQMVYKPGSKSSKIIFSASVPELEKIVSNYVPSEESRYNLAGIQYIPSIDKRFPLKMMALTAKMDPKSFKDALPFKSFADFLPKVFKPGQPYYDVNIKKDGKRKVKFSAWGGKRSPPIIGPIWTPAPENVKDSTLDTIILIRNAQDKDVNKAV